MKTQKQNYVSEIKALKLFNETATKLENLSFTKKIVEKGSVVKISGEQGQPVKVEHFGPNNESIDAFVLTLRFFIQDKDNISFNKIAIVYENLPIKAGLTQEFKEVRKTLNEFLDKQTPITINNKPTKYRDVLYVFLYGSLAHMNKEKKAIYDSWFSSPYSFPVFKSEFVYTLAMFLKTIFYVKTLNEKVLQNISVS